MLTPARKARCAPSTAWMYWERLSSTALGLPVSNRPRCFEDTKTQKRPISSSGFASGSLG